MCCTEQSALQNHHGSSCDLGPFLQVKEVIPIEAPIPALFLLNSKWKWGFFALRPEQGWFISWQLTLGRDRVGGEVQHTEFSHLKLILVVAFLSAAEERSNTMTGKSSFKERESFNGQNILKVSMKQLGKWSQLWILYSQKRSKHLFKTAFVLGLWDLPGSGSGGESV